MRWSGVRIPPCLPRRCGGIGRRAGFRFQCLYDVEVQVLSPTLTVICHVLCILCFNIMALNIDINNIVRSVAVVVVGLPVALSVSSVNGSLSRSADSLTRLAEESAAVTPAEAALDNLKAEATVPCIKWLVSKVDSKLERDAKNDLDDALGGEVNYKEVCKFVLN